MGTGKTIVVWALFGFALLMAVSVWMALYREWTQREPFVFQSLKNWTTQTLDALERTDAHTEEKETGTETPTNSGAGTGTSNENATGQEEEGEDSSAEESIFRTGSGGTHGVMPVSKHDDGSPSDQGQTWIVRGKTVGSLVFYGSPFALVVPPLSESADWIDKMHRLHESKENASALYLERQKWTVLEAAKSSTDLSSLVRIKGGLESGWAELYRAKWTQSPLHLTDLAETDSNQLVVPSDVDVEMSYSSGRLQLTGGAHWGALINIKSMQGSRFLWSGDAGTLVHRDRSSNKDRTVFRCFPSQMLLNPLQHFSMVVMPHPVTTNLLFPVLNYYAVKGQTYSVSLNLAHMKNIQILAVSFEVRQSIHRNIQISLGQLNATYRIGDLDYETSVTAGQSLTLPKNPVDNGTENMIRQGNLALASSDLSSYSDVRALGISAKIDHIWEGDITNVNDWPKTSDYELRILVTATVKYTVQIG
mmetsp:Transcript_40502/g.105067  ORF Transcript_40502/g.105067 Transcript_40502/m.105067 type:complete len:477 (-) Transcript_40502:5135-6565(-)|eukprot:CAMPEP_0113916104 /NCGR_PEP_ID=MMETSP0780_2-20120614/31799_1 /TAXON_ID=652834 /ORGANISM="Palpitomonas bilix" /LENGTH=476 /DNA_ID=CAMNT_0000915141 /DNA_START=1872 /DNA_END=3302 /DNA_ORIENTATION=- /assembly_acc=CAM_ASM_000599